MRHGQVHDVYTPVAAGLSEILGKNVPFRSDPRRDTMGNPPCIAESHPARFIGKSCSEEEKKEIRDSLAGEGAKTLQHMHSLCLNASLAS